MRADVTFMGGPAFLPPGRRVEDVVVSVAGGVIRSVGRGGDPPPADRVIDLGGRMLLAGFQDAHVHPIHGGLRRLRCDLTDIDDVDVALAEIVRAASRARAWILGGGWSFSWFDRGCPSADLLDRLTGNMPAYLVVRDGHSAWVNHAALRAAGVDADTPDPPDGRIERLPDGSPQGTLHEGAMGLVERVAPRPSAPEVEAALEEGRRVLFSHGITAWQDAWVTDVEHAAYRSLAEDGRLRAAVRGAVWWDRERGLDQIEDVRTMTGETVGRYRPEAVKLMLDGVCENFTASMLEPYVGDHREGGSHRGIDFIDPLALKEIVPALDAAGIQCHFHAIGDAAVRNALDAVELARERNGDRGARHHLAHLQVVHPDDVSRFGLLDVTANCQALWACNEPAMTELTVPFLGPDRERHQYPFASIASTGGRLAMGSDWPVSSPDVMAQIHVAVTRTPPGELVEPFQPTEALTITQALSAFTSGSAHVNRLDPTRGSIAVGNVADLVVLASDPFVGGRELWEIGVDITMVDGSVVFENGSEAW